MATKQIALIEGTQLNGDVIELLYVGAIDENDHVFEISHQLPFTANDQQTYRDHHTDEDVTMTDADLLEQPRYNYNTNDGSKWSGSPAGTYRIIKVLR